MPNPRSRLPGRLPQRQDLPGRRHEPRRLRHGTERYLGEYDAVNDPGRSRLPIPVSASSAASAVVDGHLYVIGGRTRLAPTLNTVYDYDIAMIFWTLLDAHLPSDVGYPGGTAVQGRVWVIGGLRGSTTYVAQIFDPRTRTFSEGPSLNVARYGWGPRPPATMSWPSAATPSVPTAWTLRRSRRSCPTVRHRQRPRHVPLPLPTCQPPIPSTATFAVWSAGGSSVAIPVAAPVSHARVPTSPQQHRHARPGRQDRLRDPPASPTRCQQPADL